MFSTNSTALWHGHIHIHCNINSFPQQCKIIWSHQHASSQGIYFRLNDVSEEKHY